MWVNVREREKNKEKHVNGAMFLTVAFVGFHVCPLLNTKHGLCAVRL
jgi:hypothetical protein